MDKSEHIKDLILRFQENMLSPAEVKELSLLLGEGDQNPELLKQMDQKWQDSFYETIDIPTTKILENIRHQTGLNNRSEKPESIHILKKYLQIAAILIIILVSDWGIRISLSDRPFPLVQKTEQDQNNIVTVAYGSKARIMLPDGSVVNLNSGSTLKYPVQFKETNRHAYIEGEAFFDIKKDPEHPFYVQTKDITIKVLGTKFNVKSYNEEKTIQTTLVTGKIEIYSKQNSKLLILSPNQQAVFNKDNQSITTTVLNPESLTENQLNTEKQLKNKSTDLSPFIAWKDNKLIFKDEQFQSLAKKLERWYDVKIEIKEDVYTQYRFSGVFVNETIEQAMEALKLATPFNYQIDKNNIIITK